MRDYVEKIRDGVSKLEENSLCAIEILGKKDGLACTVTQVFGSG